MHVLLGCFVAALLAKTGEYDIFERMIIDGKAIAEDVYAKLADAGSLSGARLAIVVMDPTRAIESFVRIKTRAAERLGVEMVRTDLNPEDDTEEVVAAVKRAVRESEAVIVQLPLPPHVDLKAVLAAIPATHDVDAINPKISRSSRLVQAPVALAVAEVLERAGVSPKGKRAVVAGAGRLVGAPSAALLAERGAEVTTVSLDSGSLASLKGADIVVLGMGEPHVVKPAMIKKGAVVIDAGTSDAPAEGGSSLAGDADPACATVASVFTPVPGGIGPIAVAMIFKNLEQLVSA
jgi:methylenetetrahydrofolate dehydrogenase (NADP+) / methenyltetrahydrofolate cyclohydrolase